MPAIELNSRHQHILEMPYKIIGQYIKDTKVSIIQIVKIEPLYQLQFMI